MQGEARNESHAQRVRRTLKNGVCPRTTVCTVPVPRYERGFPIGYFVSCDHVLARHTGMGSVILVVSTSGLQLFVCAA